MDVFSPSFPWRKSTCFPCCCCCRRSPCVFLSCCFSPVVIVVGAVSLSLNVAAVIPIESVFPQRETRWKRVELLLAPNFVLAKQTPRTGTLWDDIIESLIISLWKTFCDAPAELWERRKRALIFLSRVEKRFFSFPPSPSSSLECNLQEMCTRSKGEGDPFSFHHDGILLFFFFYGLKRDKAGGINPEFRL